MSEQEKGCYDVWLGKFIYTHCAWCGKKVSGKYAHCEVCLRKMDAFIESYKWKPQEGGN